MVVVGSRLWVMLEILILIIASTHHCFVLYATCRFFVPTILLMVDVLGSNASGRERLEAT